MQLSKLFTTSALLLVCGALSANINNVEVVRSSPGDLSGDGIIDRADLRLMSAYFEGAAMTCSMDTIDFNRDRRVDIADFVGLAELVTARDGQPIAVTVVTVSIRLGDVTNDGVIDGKDVDALASYLAGEINLESPIDAADVNRDRRLDVADLSMLAEYVYGRGR
ncbi:MAG: dockerin type I domain-containing protein [Planctomycetota bacterium]